MVFTRELIALGAVLITRTGGAVLSIFVASLILNKYGDAIAGQYFWFVQFVFTAAVIYRRGLETSLLKLGKTLSNYSVLVFVSRFWRWYLGCSVTIFFFIITPYYPDIPSPSRLLPIILVPALALLILASETSRARGSQFWATVSQTLVIPGTVAVGCLISSYRVMHLYAIGLLASILMAAILLAISESSIQRSGVLQGELNTIVPHRAKEENQFFLASLCNLTLTSCDVLLLGLLGFNNAVALYFIAARISSTSSILLGAVNGLIAPRIAELWSTHQLDALRQYFIKWQILCLAMAVFYVVALVSAAPYLVSWIYGEPDGRILLFLQILLIGSFCSLAAGPTAYMLMMTERTGLHIFSLVCSAVLTISILPFAVMNYGALGAALVVTFGTVVKSTLSFGALYFRTPLVRR